jgi:pimeloyl-ACP methyl ester carboxylesterase
MAGSRGEPGGGPTTGIRSRRQRRRRRAAVLGGGVLLLLVLVGVAGCALFGGDFKPVVATPEMARLGLESRFAVLSEWKPGHPLKSPLKIHYVVAGDAARPAVLFVHGSPGTWEAWRGYLEDAELRRRARLIALDRPGFGATARGHAEPSLARQAAACVAVLDAEHVRRAIVVGHSLGGPIAAELAADDPDRVAALALVAPSIDPRHESHRWFNVAGAMMAVQWFLPIDLITSNREIWPLRPQLAALGPRLGTLPMPTIVLQGDRDTLVSPANADYAAQVFPAGRVDVRRLAGATHFVVWQDPAIVERAILDLLGKDG